MSSHHCIQTVDSLSLPEMNRFWCEMLSIPEKKENTLKDAH